jgi:predicted small lipoprotein YifL
MRAILTVVICLLLSACGLKDDLYLPAPGEQTESDSIPEEAERGEDA